MQHLARFERAVQGGSRKATCTLKQEKAWTTEVQSTDGHGRSMTIPQKKQAYEDVHAIDGGKEIFHSWSHASQAQVAAT